ncbi:hypothetical protein J2S49_000414 [Arcanobacterium wilhelmae]|uniref:Uncharacterized protein n=1 Tax=Arcanobacterium wilhelmae TaxID=1803177 RepID=A0ABT9N9F9_9ACTO|nr:hypothetical protein [Arcanobacterium wilhelmae]MDP9800338.1 hypothetical protein [Arcanobacterium wilhelmae]WFN89774.1 hypothetical protein P8A24_06080 [Arcanobacterium wilhelmae]
MVWTIIFTLALLALAIFIIAAVISQTNGVELTDPEQVNTWVKGRVNDLRSPQDVEVKVRVSRAGVGDIFSTFGEGSNRDVEGELGLLPGGEKLQEYSGVVYDAALKGANSVAARAKGLRKGSPESRAA